MDEPEDVLEHGSSRSRRPWLPAVGVVLVLALLGYVIVTRTGDPGQAADGSATPTAASNTSPSPWPTVTGACGRDIPLPRATSQVLDRSTGAQVLVGVGRLVRIDLDSRRRAAVSDRPGRDRETLELARHGDQVYALVAGCHRRDGQVLRYSGHGQARRVEVAGRVDDLIGGPAGAWAVDLPAGGPEGRAVLRPLTGGKPVWLPKRVLPVGVAADGIVGQRTGNPLRNDPSILLIDPATGQIDHRIGGGQVVAVGADFVLSKGPSCRFVPGENSPDTPDWFCILHRSPIGDGDGRRYRMPADQVPFGQAVLSADARFAAFPLAHARAHPPLIPDPPMPPADVAVLDLHTGKLQRVPHLQLAPFAFADMAFTTDNNWLVLAANYGDHVHLLVWRRGSEWLLRLPGRLAGGAREVPVTVLP